jgi:RES domain-containing protein
MGAERRGGRWNRVGTRAAYASSTRSLAALEYLAHVDSDELPSDLVFVGIAFHDDLLERGDPPTGWELLGSSVAIDYGQTWLSSSTFPILAVPSAIVKAERNFVINPVHARARKLVVDGGLEEFFFDRRLLANARRER